jgi:hypothetical protein
VLRFSCFIPMSFIRHANISVPSLYNFVFRDFSTGSTQSRYLFAFATDEIGATIGEEKGGMPFLCVPGDPECGQPIIGQWRTCSLSRINTRGKGRNGMTVDRNFCCSANIWARSDALLFLYFSDDELFKSRQDVLKQSRDFLDCRLTGRRFSTVLMDRDLSEALDSMAARLKIIEPRLGLITKASNLLWIRFAFQNMMKSVQPAQAFLDWYAIWRYSVATGVSTGKACRLIVSQREHLKPPRTEIHSTTNENGIRVTRLTISS